MPEMFSVVIENEKSILFTACHDFVSGISKSQRFFPPRTETRCSTNWWRLYTRK